MAVEGCRKTTVQAPLYPPLLSTFFPSLLQLSTLAIPRDVGLGFFGSSLGSWRFCLMSFVWGLCWASIRLRFGGFPYRWSRLIAGSEHNKQGAENTQKELQGKGRFSFFGTSGKDHGSFSLLPPRCPGLIEDRRADKKKNTSFFWPHFLGDPSSTPNRIERVSFFLFFSILFPGHLPCAHLGWFTLSVDTWSSSDDTARLLFSISV